MAFGLRAGRRSLEAAMAQIELTVNGEVAGLDAPPEMPLLWALRDLLGLTGTKYGCGIGRCGSCTVHLDGEAARSCVTTLEEVGRRRVTTIEGLGIGGLHPLQEAFLEFDVAQCGYCQPGQIMAAAALLAREPSPSRDTIDAVMRGVLCRCGTYLRIRRAIEWAAERAS
jgi:aerobic-type carbon monoxide dehydrogenase small subunit (CoxS/CutS family)